ncbi:MAG: CoA-binding protein [Deltaproteobacteria bacterium]|nr:CoA-binding protein [Deltaproteobacteria bacterium]
MHKRGSESFSKYFVGIDSLEEIATKEDRICVLNILGNESRGVTPTSHAFSGGNVVFGTMPGRSGQVLETPAGNVPVYNNVPEGLAAGHAFNTAVIYLPPSGVRDAVAEVARSNPELKKIVILTEKVPVKDARIIRAIGQMYGLDIFGANALGVADSHNKVRIGGALGGTHPEESLIPGSVAIYSNSGNFTTTIAFYLLSKGWGTTTSISSGKDIYIHFSAPEFVNAMENDKRTKAGVMYIEPGGYYESALKFNKPVVTCIVGRWKKRLSKAVGHAGSLAGSGDDALAKEKWFMNYFGVDNIFTPEKPVYSKKGAVVINIAHIPEALNLVMEANGVKPDFTPKGDLSKKAWFGNNMGVELPPELDVPVVNAIEPYSEQIETVNKQVGATFPRRNMKDASGASRMDPKTQVTQVHNISVLDATRYTLEKNLVMSLIREYPTNEGAKLAGIILNAMMNQHGQPALAAAEAARAAKSSPNSVLSAAAAIVGPATVDKSRKAADTLRELFQHKNITDPINSGFDFSEQLSQTDASVFIQSEPDALASHIANAVANSGIKSVFVDFVLELARTGGGHATTDALLGAITTTLAWAPFMRKRVSVITINNLPWHFKVCATLVGVAAPAAKHGAGSFLDLDIGEMISGMSFGETAYTALIGRRPTQEELDDFNIILGLVISNGPGTISAQGAKGAVSADGPEDPFRVQINKGYIGFLTHTGFAHGGNGYEAIAFLLDRFKDSGLKDPGDEHHGLNLEEIATKYAEEYRLYKDRQKEVGNITYAKIPCVNHPVFKGQPVNHDPREVFVRDLFKNRGSYNVFLEFYHNLVEAMFKAGVSKNVYCVNVDAVIAVIILKLLWEPYNRGEIKDNELESIAFTVFLFGRILGTAAEIEDHINRGRNMDTRTAASKCEYVE